MYVALVVNGEATVKLLQLLCYSAIRIECIRYSETLCV
jgi:hypothetical protein